MTLFEPTFVLAVLLTLYIASFIVFALVRIVTGVSILRIGYFSLRHIAYVPRDGLKINLRGLGLLPHRPSFAQPTWLSIALEELVITVDSAALEASSGHDKSPAGDPDATDDDLDDLDDLDHRHEGAAASHAAAAAENADAPSTGPSRPPPKPAKIASVRRAPGGQGRSKTWERLTNLKNHIKRLHRKVEWLRMLDVVATNTTVNFVGVGSVQVGSFTLAIDTRRKMIDRARFFLQGRAGRQQNDHQAEWIMTLRSVLLTASGNEPLEVLDSLSLNIHGFLCETQDGLRDAAVSIKLGRLHIPYDDLVRSLNQYKKTRASVGQASPESESMGVVVDKVLRELDSPGSTDHELMQTVSDSKEFVSSTLRGIKEVQLAVSFVGFTRRIHATKVSGDPLLLNVSMKEVGIDLHRLDPKSPAHRMYFPSKDIAHEALAAALSISLGVDDGHGKAERLLYIPMATTTVKTTLPSKTMELADEVSAEQRNANILFANSVITSPSVDLHPHHLPLLLAMLTARPRPRRTRPRQRHMLISRLLPKATVKFSMHEPVLRIALPTVQKTVDPDDFDLIISSISSVSLDVESFHSAAEERHYSLAASVWMQTHELYYQTSAGTRFDLLETESFDLKLQLSATPDVRLVGTGNIQTMTVKMVRREIGDALRQIMRQLRLDVQPEKRVFPRKPGQSNFVRAVPPWLIHFQLSCSDFSLEVAGVDENLSDETRGFALQLESWSADYRAQRLDGLRRPARRRASSRVIQPSEVQDLSHAIPMSPPRRKTQLETDGRRLSVTVRGFEAFVVESAERWEIEPFVNIPKLEMILATSSDRHGPLLHVSCHVRTLLLQYSLYRHYAVGVAILVLRKAFLWTSRDRGEPKSPSPPASPTKPRVIIGHLSPPPAGESGDYSLSDSDSLRSVEEATVVDVKVNLVQVKGEMPTDPPILLQIYHLETGRRRWSSPHFHSKLIRLCAEAPRMRRVWAKIVSIKNMRVDYRESRRKMPSGSVQEERMFDIASEAIRLAVPHELVVYKITDNLVNVLKAVQQLHHRFQTGTNEYILDKGPEGPRHVPKVSLRARTFVFELEDGAFEWKLGMIYRTGRIEQMQRQAREEAFEIKKRKIQEEEMRKGSSKLRTRSMAPSSSKSQNRLRPESSAHYRSHSADGRDGTGEGRIRGRAPRYDPEAGCLGISGEARVPIAEARYTLDVYNARSWRQRIDRSYLETVNIVRDQRNIFWGSDVVPDDLDESENILEIPRRPGLGSAIINDLHVVIDKPSFPLRELPEFLHKVGKGMPKDMKYSLLVPMHVQICMGEGKIILRDYPLPLLHVPCIKPDQSSRLPALSLKTDFVIAEEFRGPTAARRVNVQVVPPRNPNASNEGSFAIDVRRTIGAVKSFSDMVVDVHTANPTRITWGPSYQPAIQDMMMAIESLTKPQLDPSESVGFWDKIRLNLHTRVRIAWREDGPVHFALKGTRDPYKVTGNGAGFLMCWRNDVRWNIHTSDDPKRFLSVDSHEYVLAIPDYSQEARQGRRSHDGEDNLASDRSYTSAAAFKKVAMKLQGNVQWLGGLVFERAIRDGQRSFEFRPHYDVVLKAPQHAKSEDGLPYDAFRGFRSQHIHLSIAVRAPADRDWSTSSSVGESSPSYNSVHVTPRFFTHFFDWWSLFSGPLSLPVRQGALWPGRERSTKKFGRHLATFKYNLLLAPLYLSHIYKHKDAEDPSNSNVSATGLKVRFDSWILDLHQRREEFNTRDRGCKTGSKTSGMKIHAGQLDLVSADIRAVSASIRGTTEEAIRSDDPSAFMAAQDEDGADPSRFDIPDQDPHWIDADDFVELDSILPTGPNPRAKILPLAFAPRITYFRQTDIDGVIEGDPDRLSPFGNEPTHFCVMSQDDDPRRVQGHLIHQRLGQLDQQLDMHGQTLDRLQLRLIRNDQSEDFRSQFDIVNRHTVVLGEKREFLQGMLKETVPVLPLDSEEHLDPTAGVPDANLAPSVAELASDFKNRFVVHNLQLKWNNTLRNIIIRYIHQVSQRRGFVYYLSRPAVKFILDIVEEQMKSKAAKDGSGPSPSTATPNAGTSDREMQKDIEDRVRKILQDGRKFVNADDAGQSGPVNSAMDDLTGGLADEFTPQNSYHVRVIAPQIQLQCDRNTKHVVLIAAKGMDLKVVEVLDKARISDNVSGLVQRRFLLNMDSTQFFVTHQAWFSTKLVSMYSGNTYGCPRGSSWPPWVPMEVMYDFESDPWGFKRVVQKTSAMLRYDQYNTLRLKYNDEVNMEAEGARANTHDNTESKMDFLWVDFPRLYALCNSSQYYAMYVIVLDLLLYNEPTEKTRSERLEKIMLASDFSDLRGAPEMVMKLQERVRQLEDINTHFQIHSQSLDRKGWQDRLLLERDLAACEDELFFMMKAITTSQRKFDSATSSALLKWSITAREIVWHLIRDNNEPLVELQLKEVVYDRTDNADGSHINLFQVKQILGLNLQSDAIYPAMITPYSPGNELDPYLFDTGSQPMIRVYWYMLEAIAGIPVMDHLEVNLFPLRLQIEHEVGQQLFEYVFPGMDREKDLSGAAASNTTDYSPFIINDDEMDDVYDEDESISEQMGFAASHGGEADALELRLRPTLTSDPKAIKAKPPSELPSENPTFRLFRSTGTWGGKTVKKKGSYDSLRDVTSTPRPGAGRAATSFATLKDAVYPNDSRRGSRLLLRGGNKNSGNGHGDDYSTSSKKYAKNNKAQKSDDLTKMIDRASSYMTFAHIKLPSVVLCLSYKGKGDRNITDVHDFVFRLPTIEWRNKTWSNLDLALELKSRVVKALISHTGALIGNKFVKHRPNTAQQSKIREMVTSTARLATTMPSSARLGGYMPNYSGSGSGGLITPGVGSSIGGGDNSDVESESAASLYSRNNAPGHSPVDWSRSPPVSMREAVRPSSRSRPRRSQQPANMSSPAILAAATTLQPDADSRSTSRDSASTNSRYSGRNRASAQEAAAAAAVGGGGGGGISLPPRPKTSGWGGLGGLLGASTRVARRPASSGGPGPDGIDSILNSNDSAFARGDSKSPRLAPPIKFSPKQGSIASTASSKYGGSSNAGGQGDDGGNGNGIGATKSERLLNVTPDRSSKKSLLRAPLSALTQLVKPGGGGGGNASSSVSAPRQHN